MPALIGFTAGGCVLVLILSWLLEWALFKRLVNTAETGIMLSVVSAVILAIVIYGFGNRVPGGTWNAFPGGISYIVGGCIVLPLRLRAYRKRAERTADEDALAHTFE